MSKNKEIEKKVMKELDWNKEDEEVKKVIALTQQLKAQQIFDEFKDLIKDYFIEDHPRSRSFH